MSCSQMHRTGHHREGDLGGGSKAGLRWKKREEVWPGRNDKDRQGSRERVMALEQGRYKNAMIGSIY